MENYDLIVIGSGPAGERGATQAARLGKRVALIERAPHMGGAGINTGTIPSRTLREAALFYSGLQRRGLSGIDYALRPDISVGELMLRERIVLERERQNVRTNLSGHAITLVHGQAAFQDPHTVQVSSEDGQRTLRADVILIATGAAPQHPEGIPFDGRLIYDSETLLQMDRIPRSLAVVGGGVIGTEYASVFAALGTQVTLIEPRERLLPFVDYELIRRLQAHLESLQANFLLGHKVTAFAAAGNQVQLQLNGAETLRAERVLVAVGRQGNVQGLGLERIGIEVEERGLIPVNQTYQTRVPHIYAAGDVIGFPALASTSMEQARTAMAHAFDPAYQSRPAHNQPLAIYAIPEISMVGLTEEACREQQIPHVVGRGYYENSPRGQIIGDMSGMVKLIFSPADRKLLGAHVIGEQASELIHIAAHVMLEGGTLESFRQSVYNYPTLADLYRQAADDAAEHWVS